VPFSIPLICTGQNNPKMPTIKWALSDYLSPINQEKKKKGKTNGACKYCSTSNIVKKAFHGLHP
jgi:hypothetical protein